MWLRGRIGILLWSCVIAQSRNAGRQLQSFFEDEIDFSCQSYLPLGVVRSDRDSQPRVCTVCSVLPWARRASHEQICRLDVSNCSVLQPGEQCTIRCREPYYAGDPVTALCPWDNSEESGGGLSWEEPDCDIQCPDFPGGRPDGYVVDDDGNWHCAPGYIGKAEYLCTLHDDCVARPSLSGCTAMVHCLAPFDVDLCMLNLSTCYLVMPGRTSPGSCQLGCNAPFWAGEPTIATCKAGNVDPFTPLNWTMPTCEPRCPPGTPIPEGYVLENGQWRCADTHYGTPRPSCVVNDQCVAEWRPTGCDLMHPCVAPDDDLCRYNMSQCLNVPPGGSCIVRCRDPFVGGASLATCVENNIDPNQELTWQPPRPSCALLLCPELELVPVGYQRHSDGWRCAPGYAGEAKAFCEVEPESCFAATALSGCALQKPCWPLEVDDCVMDASDCMGVAPGGSCFVRCKAPYQGTPGIAQCPPENTDPWATVAWGAELPNCSLPSCPDPVSVPRSYAQVNGQWTCAAGFAGKAEVLCRHGPDCQPSAGELAGCGNPSACSAPTSLTCSVDMSDCATVLPGQTCHVHCAYPFQGQPTVAECPLDNLDPAGLRWRPPACTQFCPDPDLSAVPPGYYKTGAGWACALGYRGTAQKICSMDDRCMPTATILEGCAEEVPCATLPQQAACGFDVSDCAAVPAGGSCEVRCKAPFFVGPTSQASCPKTNTDPQQMLTWIPQICSMTCPPATSQEGYLWSVAAESDDGQWICAPGWTGQVQVVCSMENCDVSPSTLTGCVRLQTCTVPEADPCLYTFDCGREAPGDTCLVQCRSPYVGQPTVAKCPDGNTVVQPLEWTPPSCECPDPSPIPEGYLKSEEGWHCAPGFVGHVVKSCNSTRTCFSAPKLWGCAKVHGCLPLDLDNCEYDFSNCSDVQSGESCEIKCNPPYVLAEGGNGRAECPAENVNRFERMSWTLPSCRLDCPEINPVPVAYQRLNGSWVCAAGYAGSVQVDCYLSSYCSSEPSLEGCNKEEPCFPIELDQCVFDTSRCRGSGACHVGCKAPYEGQLQLGRCPPGNLVPQLWPSFSLPSCRLPEGCVDPLPIPVGYVKTADGWRCDKGYSGTVHVQCVLGDDTCQQLQPILTGCSLIRPCKMPPVDMCIFDLGACGDGSVPDGTNCTARCRLPYNGTVTTAYCPEGNTDPDQELIWTQPHCELVDCLDPLPIPPGYTKLLNGGWSCATGYTGVVDGCCQFNDICMPRLTLSGCYPIGPCAMPTPDRCQFDLNDCPTTPLGFTCSLRCQFPYDGVTTEANCSEGAGAPPESERSLKMPAPRCSSGTNDAVVLPQQLYYTLPNCFCPDPFVTPEGYEKNGTVWQCAKGYAGDAELLCQDGDLCLPEPTLRGCFPLQQCKEPEVDPADRCRYDISDCIQYPPRAGETCIIRCKTPYEGTFGFAGCPADNTVFNRSSVWLENVAKPVCDLNCPDPSDVPFGFIYIMPDGYMKDAANNWMCAPGYAGTVTFACSFGPNCTLINEPAGCLPFALCNGMITTSAADNCSLDTSLCHGIGPGVSCNIHCRSPYVGPPGEAICPYNNTDPLQQVEWVFLPACYCPDTCQEQEGYLKIVEDPSIYFRRLFHLGAADAAGPFKCDDGWLGSPLLECRMGSECFDEVTLFGCDQIKPCIAPRLSRHMALPMDNSTDEPLPFQAEAEFAAANPSAVVPWLPRAQDVIPEHCMYDLSDCHEVDVGSACKVSCLWPLLPDETDATCPDKNIKEKRMVNWRRPDCVLGQCVDPNPLPEGMEKTWEGYRCALGYAGEIRFQCITSPVREGCGTKAVPGGCKKMQSCSAPLVDPCSHDVSECANVPTGGSCVIRCKFPFSGFSTIASCPMDNTIENRPVDWTPQICLSSACPIPRVMPEGYAIARDGSFTCARGYMGVVSTSCSHDPNNDCAANDLSFEGCVPSRNCNRCLDPDPLPPGYVWDPSSSTWHCDVGYRGIVAERCDSCTKPVILGGCVPLTPCLPPQVERCMFDVLDCWNLSAGAECQVYVRRPFVGNNTVARCPPSNTDFAQEALWDGSVDNATCPDPIPPDGYVKVNGEWTCNVATHRGTAELRCQALDRCLREPELVGCRRLQQCVAPDLPDPCAVESGCQGTLPGEDCNVTCREPYVGDYVVASCDADNIQPNAKVEVDSFPQCTLRCPDPAVTPEGYAKVNGEWQCAEGFGGIPAISCVRTSSENRSDCRLNITMSGCLPLVSCARPVVDSCSTYIPEECNFTAGSSCWVFCGEHFRMQQKASFPQIDWEEDLNLSIIPEWFSYGEIVPYAIAVCPANNTVPNAIPLWSPAPRCVLDCPYPSYVPPGYRERQRFNRWRCDEGYTGTAILDCTLWENCSVTSWLSGCDELVPCALPAVEDPCVYDFESFNCSSVMGGETCEVKCKLPYTAEGPATATASCPELNIDPQHPLAWQPHMCNYTCSDPDPIPAGYLKSTAAQISIGVPEWICASGYSGEAVASCNIDENCLAIIALSGCLPIVPCVMPDVDTCMYDLSGCTAMLPGQFCFVGCLAPYALIGDSTFASCSSTNTDPNKVMEWTPPVCDCPGPTTLPAGYDRSVSNSLTSYSCLSGYVGEPVVNCSIMGESCFTEAQFGGCIPTIACEIPSLDPCRMDFSACGSEVAPGASCTVSCGVYVGNSTTANCPEINTEQNGLLIPEDFQCDCPEPSSVPTGYARSGNGWECAVGYVGEVLHTCSTDASCNMQVQLSGCEELQPCESLESNCLYDASNCSGVMPGETCDIFCQDPYVGTPTVGRCPEGNTMLNTSLNWKIPICNYTVCPTPEFQSVDGFELTTVGSQQSWQCASGYGGQAVESCPIYVDPLNSSDCTSNTVLVGCLPVVGCVKPSADECVYNTSECDNLGPGQFCVLRCHTNYEGTSTGGYCLDSNTNPNRLVEWTRPSCRMVCPDPAPMPRGYWRSNVTGFLECAPGFWGSANSFCSRKFPGCDIETTLFGCYELFPCVFPEIDPCIYDYDPTVQLWGGESLTIQCKRPYRGFQSTAMCPPNNLDATRAFMWFPGDCFCPDPCPIPPGYVKTGPGYDNWVCGQGYTGTSLLHCGSESKCQEVPLLSGCTKAVPCARLNLTDYRCDVELMGCEDLQPGQSCTVACAMPYSGASVTALCPQDNGDENAQPILQGELNCILDSCNATDEIPVGYVKTHDGWRCDEGYGGTPAVHCGFSPAGAFQGGRGCGFEMHPSGCKPLVPCVPPSSLEGCKYDTSSCGSVVPGQECQLKCRKPYSGLGVFAACPGDNTDPTQEVILPVGSFLDCDCPAPAPEFVPAGYMQNTEGDWVCGPGFAGTAVKRCERPDTCLDEPEFLGCFPLKPCIIPDVDTCMFDLSDCVNVMPGETCSIYCVPPYKQDQVQNATCRLGNIDPLQPIEWEIGRCDLDWEDCKDPLPLPVGYEKRSDGFHCAAGYVGAVEVSPTVHCGPWANCGSTPKLTGCFPLESCRPVRFDDCAYNTSQCPYDFKPGQECQVTCKAPYVGPPSVARCSSNNIDWQGAFEWVASECFCPNPRTVPEGYFQNASGWFCDTNNSYTGEAEVVCSQPGFCLAEPMVIGCQKSGPCVAPLLDHCMFDASSCDGVEIARQCVISCAAGFIGASTTAFCENPGGQFGLQYTEPSCRLDFCPDPAVMPGYLWNTSGWFCADGFEGSAQKLCSHDGSCAVYSWLSGCTPIRTPCSLPALGCRYDVSNCSAITPGEYCEVKCAAPFAGTPSRAVCAPGNSSEGRPGGPSSPPEELLLTLPYCDLEGCPDPDPIPVGYQRVGEIFTCTEGFVGQAIMQCRETQPCEHVLTLSGCTNATEIAISLAQLIEAPSQRDFSPCQAGEACGEPDDVPEGYDKFLGEWRCSVGFAGSAGIQCSARRNCQSTPTLSGCVPIEACLPIIADGCDIDVSDCRSVQGGESCEIKCKDPYTGPSTYGTCPEGNINTSEVLTWSRPQCALTNCPQGLVVQDGYIKDSILGWICANGFKGDASVNCSINDACEAECVYGGCDPIEVCRTPPVDACRFNWTDCDGILPGRSCHVSCMPPYLGQRTMANCRATAPLGPNLTSTSPPELDWTPPICQCPEASPAPGYTRVIDAPEETWQCDEEFGGSAAKRCQRPLECLDAPELFGCLPLQPCVPPISTARCEPLDMSNCSEVPPGESCEVRCVPPFVGAPSIASCPAENLILNQVLTMPVEPCVLGCKDPPVHPGYQKRGEDWRCDREDRFNGTANVFCELDESCGSMKKFEGCIPTTRPCLAPPLDLCQYDVSDCLSVAPNSSCVIGCAGNYAGQPVEAMCPEGNVQDNGLKFTAPRCVAEEIDCPLPAVLPTGYKLDGRDVVCEDDYVGSFVSHRCGHDAQCNKVLELTGCVKPVKCSPLKIEPCERDNLGCWDVEAGGSCSIGCKPPFFGPSSLASCPAGNTDPTTPLEFDLISCLCSDPPVIPDGYSQDIFGQWSCDPGYAGTAEARCRVGETCIADSELVGCEKLEPCRDLTPTSCDQDVSDCTDVQPGGTCFVTCRQPWTSIESTLGTCPDDNVDPMRTVTWTHPTCELRCPAPNPMPDGFVWDEATRTASCKEGYLGPASTVCIVNNMTCEVTTFVSGCQKLMPCLLPPVDPCRVNMTSCRDVMPGESCRPRCIQPFELYGPAALARCPENNLLPDTELQWLQFPNCSVFECEDPSPVPAGYAFGINENDPVAVGHGVPRWYCAPGYVGIAERVCSGNATCGVVAFLSGCLPIIACRAPVVDTCRVDDSRCGSIRPGSRCTLSCRPPFVGAQTVASCSVRNTEPDGLLFRSPICTLPSNFDPIPLDTGFSSTYEGYRCGVGYAGRIQTVCRMQAGCRTTTYPVGCAPPVPCKVGNFQDEDGRGGFIAGNISFGRAQLDTMLNAGQARDFRSNTPLRFSGKGTIYEDEIDSYDVYFVDSCNRTLGNALTSVAIKDATDQILCCDETVYNISLVDLRMTEEVKGLAVIARIRNSLGLEPSVNYWVVTIEDRIDPITNAAIRMTQTAVVAWLLGAFFLS